jgi:hypothetical protein
MSPLRAGRPSPQGINAPEPSGVVDASALLEDLGSRFARAQRNAGSEDIRLVVAGRTLLIRFAGPAMRDALLPAFRHLVQGDGGGSAELQIDVWDGESSGVEPPEVSWGTEGGLGLLGDPREDQPRAVCDVAYGAITAVGLGGRRAFFQVPSASRLPWYERAAPLRVALNNLLFAAGAMLVHAGAVGDRSGGALLVGRGGSGKSTLAVACALEGMGFAGDDYVAITLDGDPSAHSVHATAKLTDRSLELLPELTVSPRPLPPDEKHVIQMDHESPTAIRRRLPLRAIVGPRITEGESSWSRIGGAEGLRILAPSTLLQLPPTGRRALSVMASLARTVPSYSLDLGSDPAASVAALREILSDAG